VITGEGKKSKISRGEDQITVKMLITGKKSRMSFSGKSDFDKGETSVFEAYLKQNFLMKVTITFILL